MKSFNYTFFVLFLVSLSAFGSFVNDMYQPALPQMVRFFHTTVPTVQLGLTMGMIGLALGQFVLGPVSDKYGRKPVLVWAMLLFVAAAAVSIFSPTIWFFLGCRLFQGIGASAGYFLARTIPADVFMGPQLAKTMAVIGAINGFAPACAPVLGGVVAEHYTWKGIFVALIVLAVSLLVLSRFFGETLPQDKRYKGSILSSFRQYLPLLRQRPFMTHVVLKGAALGFLFAYVSALPFIFEDHFGLSETAFGLVMGGNALFVALGSMVALKFKPLKRAAWVGALLLMATTAVEAAVMWVHPTLWLFELLLLPMVFSLGLIFTVSNTLAMNEGRQAAGAASALLGIVGYLFGGVAAPLVGLGDIFHSTAVVLLVMAAITLAAALVGRKLPIDLYAK